jgi:carboxypeptidase C (cathepsin A)
MKQHTSFKAILLGVSLLFSLHVLAENERKIDPDSQIVTKHKTTINDQTVKYTATTGTQPAWDEEGQAVAALHYTYYQRSDVEENASRPLVISFNGGPGSASVWMHIAYTGPRILKINDEGYPVQPYGIDNNPYSILDVADIVYINPVNTGYSRILEDKDGKLPDKDKQKEMFFGVNADIKYLAEWLNTFVTRNNRWRSPKYLIGESYGTTRVSGLALELQDKQWMYLNGVILVSPTDLGIKRDGPVKIANRLPYFAATAWHHNKLAPEFQAMTLEAFLPQVETFTLNTLLPALSKGSFIEKQEKQKVMAQMAKYAGISVKAIAANNMDVTADFFWKELLRDEGKIIGRLDSRYLGIDRQKSGNEVDYFPELTSWLHSFTPAINYYLREELNYKTDVKYNMFGPVRPWDDTNNHSGENLRQAMAQNPYLNVMFQSGYFDGACNYFDAKYSMWQLDPSGKMQDRLSFKGYLSGHMMYLRHADLEKSNQDLRQFILASTPATGYPAQYAR